MIHARSGGRTTPLPKYRSEAVFVGLVMCAAIAMVGLWNHVILLGHGPDEVLHFNLDWYIATHQALPVLDRSPDFVRTFCDSRACADTYATAPVGGPLLGAALIDIQHVVTGQAYWQHPPHAVLAMVYRVIDHNVSSQSYDPFITAARLASALSIVVFVLFLYLTSRLLMDDRGTRLTALIIGAFIPQVTFLGGYVNDDSFGLAAGAAVLYASGLLLRDGLRRGTALAVGASLGCLALSKENYYAVILVFALCAALRLRREWRRRTARRFIGLLTLGTALGALLSGWWFVRNALLYSDALGLTATGRAMDAISPGYSIHHSLAAQHYTILDLLRRTLWVRMSFRSFWGYFGNMGIALPDNIYVYITLCAVIGLAGTIHSGLTHLIVRRYSVHIEPWRTQLWGAFIGLVVVMLLLSLWSSWVKDYQPQGRYLFPSLVPVALLLAIGLHGWSRNRLYRRLIFYLTMVAMGSLNIYALVFVLGQ